MAKRIDVDGVDEIRLVEFEADVRLVTGAPTGPRLEVNGHSLGALSPEKAVRVGIALLDWGMRNNGVSEEMVKQAVQAFAQGYLSGLRGERGET